MPRIEIVSATRNDAAFIAWIVAQGMHMDDVPSFLRPMTEREDTLYSWKNTKLLKVDGRIAGGLVSYDGGWHEEGKRNTWIIDGKLLSSGDVEETQAGEYYFDSLAIVPDHWGHGYWRLLFDDAVEIARSKGFQRVALICDEDYPKLGKMYASYGFESGEVIDYFGTKCRRMTMGIAT